ncbi:disease resistance protein RUN1-like [Pyrus communis]|uniref:disease resistance protein RUN1-like n=1 Tax=Pyrus communis TaxID=23211 RepID=UPI0035C064C1
MDTMAALEASSSKQWEHDVFLSFRGEDTRKTFTDSLYWALKKDGVNVFIDEKKLPRGENIRDELVEAIKRSRIAAIVFSERYADSRWCLEELEMIMECRRSTGLTVLPIFYHIDPSHVRHQTGSFAEPFQKHEERFPEDKVLRWRSALNEAGNLAGGNLENSDGYEGRFIWKFVDDVTRRLNSTYPDVAAKLVGIDSRVELISEEFDIGGSDAVRIIGILGMVGTGKTTVAQAIVSRFHQNFEGNCFLSKVREGDMVKLQNKLLRDILKSTKEKVSTVYRGTEEIERRLGNKKVLVVVDDVDCVKQLQDLAIKHDTFGPGSRIIVTARDEHLLKMLKVDNICKTQLMNKEEALKLFCCHAFAESGPPDPEFHELSCKLVEYCGGLPLALEILGSSLCTKLKSEWKSAFRILKRRRHMQIHEKLKISYDGLIDNLVKDIFLDISCFFIGMNQDYVMTILDGCDLEPEIGIGQLRDRCLVTVDEENNLLGNILKSAKVKVSTVYQGTKEIEGRLGSKKVLVVVDDVDCVKQLQELAIKRDTFGPGSRIIVTARDEHLLKILKVDNICKTQLMKKEEALKLFCCHAFAESGPPDLEFHELSSKLVDYCGGLPLALEILGSSLCTKLKSEWRRALRKLKKIGHIQILDKLKISYDGLIDNLVKDIFLDISCFFIGMNQDYVMTILDGCDLEPEIGIGQLRDRCLVTVDEGNNLMMHDLLRDMGREIVRSKSPKITGRRCRLWDQDEVKEVLREKSGTDAVEGLMLDLQESDEPIFCTEALKQMQRLRLLKLKGVKFTGNYQHLSKKLRWLCWPEFPLKVIPEGFVQSYLVDIDLSHSGIQSWKDSDVLLEKLKFLNLGYCHHLERSPDFSKLPNLEKLLLNDCETLSGIHPSIVQLKNLKHFSLANCNLKNDAIPKDLGCLSSLEVLDLRGNDFNELPTLSGLFKLQTLQLDNCKNLQEIPELPKKLEILEADECTALEKMPDFSDMLSMKELHLNHCPRLTEIPGLDTLLNSGTRIYMERCTNLNDVCDACKEIILQVLSLSLSPPLSCTHKCIS